MRRYKMLVLSNPVAGREAEYEAWYQGVHLVQMVAIPGITSAQRFSLARPMTERQSWSYATIYEIETDDIDAVLGRVRADAGTEHLIVSDALDTTGAYAGIYEACGAPAAR